MKEFKGTKGKWQLGCRFYNIVSSKKTNRPTYTDKDWESERKFYGGYLVCESVSSKADAQLIASAPEMLEALQNLILLVNDSYGVCGYHLNGAVAEWNEFEEIENARNAINKALGL